MTCMGDEMYEEDWQVRFSECDRNQQLTYSGIVNYFQDCSNLQSEKLGAGCSYLEERNRAWILDFWQIVIERRPHSFERIKTGTWASGFKGFFGLRNFIMKSKDGELLAYANSYWVYLDMLTGRPVRITEDEASVYPVEPAFQMDYADRKIPVPQELELLGETVVNEHQIDLYHHMNNGRYIELAADYLQEQQNVRQICCQYKKQAKQNDKIKIYGNFAKERETIVLKDAEDGIYAVVSFDKK